MWVGCVLGTGGGCVSGLVCCWGSGEACEGVLGRVGACWGVQGYCWAALGGWLGLGGWWGLGGEVCLSLPRRWGVESNLSFGFFGVVESGLAVVVEAGLAGLL